MSIFRIYAIVVGGTVRYVGLTRRRLRRRLREHLSRARGSEQRSPIHDFLRERMRAGGCTIAIRLLAQTEDPSEATQLERMFIRMHPEALNATPGGDIVSDTAADAISAALRGRRKSAIARIRMSVSHRRAWSRDGWRRRATTTTEMSV